MTDISLGAKFAGGFIMVLGLYMGAFVGSIPYDIFFTVFGSIIILAEK